MTGKNHQYWIFTEDFLFQDKITYNSLDAKNNTKKQCNKMKPTFFQTLLIDRIVLLLSFPINNLQQRSGAFGIA